MLDKYLSDLVRNGKLTVIWPDGGSRRYGNGGTEAALKLHGKLTPWVLRIWPEMVLGEAYMDGRLTVEHGTIADVLEILLSNYNQHGLDSLYRLRRTVRMIGRRLSQLNRIGRARKNVAHHYDLSGS